MAAFLSWVLRPLSTLSGELQMQEGVRAGAFNKVESHIVHSALELDLGSVREIMTPRPQVIWLNQDDQHDQVWHKIVVSGHSHFPVDQGNRDNTVGVVSVKALGHVPKEGETFEAPGYLFEVLDMDRHRVDKILVSPSKNATPPNAE